VTSTQAADLFTGWPDVAGEAELQAAAGLLGSVIAERYFEYLIRARPGLRPPGARRVTYLHLAFPGDLSGAREREESPGPGTPEPDR
jgi:hypothetical protein